MQYIGLIGQNISASRAPDLHHLLGTLNDLAVRYELQELTQNTEEVFAERLASLRQQAFVGTNVTFPFKQIAVEHADQVDESVRKVGSTNTLVLKDGRVAAYNTDYSGFIRGYQARFGHRAAGTVLMLGAGGVGRAVAFGLFEVGASHVYISDLNSAGAQALVASLTTAGYAATWVPTDEVEAVAAQVDGLVNCTPVGHYKTPGNPLAASAFKDQTWAFDAVYTPLDTEFLRCAHDAGIALMPGFDLFFYQGVDAFEIFTGVKVTDVTPVWQAFRQRYQIQSELID